jgi:hypothetical protein
MSHIAKVELEIKDLAALRAAVKSLGYEFMENQETYAWFGTWVGDYPLPDGITTDMLGKCSHAIRVPGCKYEIGLVNKNGKYMLLWNFWSTGGLVEKIGKNAGPIKQAYTLECVRREARLKRYNIQECKIKNGVRVILNHA